MVTGLSSRGTPASSASLEICRARWATTFTSRYMLVNVVAQRARQIASEAEDAGIPLDDKPVSIAIREVAAGKVTPTEK